MWGGEGSINSWTCEQLWLRTDGTLGIRPFACHTVCTCTCAHTPASHNPPGHPCISCTNHRPPWHLSLKQQDQFRNHELYWQYVAMGTRSKFLLRFHQSDCHCTDLFLDKNFLIYGQIGQGSLRYQFLRGLILGLRVRSWIHFWGKCFILKALKWALVCVSILVGQSRSQILLTECNLRVNLSSCSVL